MITLQNLSKHFGSLKAVDDLCLEVKKGEIFGFLGPNGAGKTTTIKILVGLMTPTQGRAFICGHDVVTNSLKTKTITGYVPDRPYIYEKLTGLEFLEFVGNIYKVEDKRLKSEIQKLLEIFELSSFKDELIESYSHGMKQKLVISAALLHNPEVFVLDEPLVGLDPKSARILKKLFLELSSQGKTIFMSTHILEIAEKMCQRVGIIQKGKLICVEEVRKIKKRMKTDLESAFLQLTEEGKTTN